MSLGLQYKNQEHIFDEKTVDGVPFLSYPMLEETGIVHHGFSTKLGGVSKGCWATMNISTTRGDDPEDVEENQRRIARAIGVKPEDMTFTNQTHTTNVAVVRAEDKGRRFMETDGMITNVPGICLVTFYADCVPLYFVDPVKKAIGLSHSGWRGTVGKIGKVTVELMQKTYGSDSKDILAAIGPSICQDCYEVSEDVIVKFQKSFEEKYAVVGMSVIACVFILGLIASLVYRPILHPRYLIPSFGCLWLGISILLSRNFEKKKLFVPIVILLLVVGSISTINFEIQQEKNYQLTLDTTQIINELDGNCNIIMYRGVIDYGINQWLDHNNHYVGVGYELDRNLTQLYGRLIDILSDPGVQNEMSHGSKAYYVFENNTKNTSVFEFNDTDQLKFTEIPNRLNDKMIIYEVQLK